jgi:hypothetical protein
MLSKMKCFELNSTLSNTIPNICNSISKAAICWERERERERERQTDRQTDRQRQTETETERDREN